MSADACSVCFSATDENRQAFLVTTIILSLLPLAMIGGAAWWLFRAMRDTADPVEIGAE